MIGGKSGKKANQKHSPPLSLQELVSGTSLEGSTDVDKVEEIRTQLLDMDRESVTNWLFEALRILPQGKWLLCSHDVHSLKVWSALVGVSRHRVRRLRKHYENGNTRPPTDGRFYSTREYTAPGAEITNTFLHWVHAHVAEPLAEGKVLEDSDEESLGQTSRVAGLPPPVSTLPFAIPPSTHPVSLSSLPACLPASRPSCRRSSTSSLLCVPWAPPAPMASIASSMPTCPGPQEIRDDAAGGVEQEESMFRASSEPALRVFAAQTVDTLEPRYLAQQSFEEFYNMLKTWCADVGEDEPPSQTTMRRVFRTTWDTKILFRGSGQHKKCDICTKLEEWRRSAVTLADKKRLGEEKMKHINMVKQDRAVYKQNSVLSEMCTRPNTAGTISPEEAVLCICLDGMDQSKFCCPRHRVYQRSKESDSLFRPTFFTLRASSLDHPSAVRAEGNTCP